jgi:hypothetical protein
LYKNQLTSCGVKFVVRHSGYRFHGGNHTLMRLRAYLIYLNTSNTVKFPQTEWR